ncbi:MAG: GNAT family N-acetyltransferase [Firmicutes bacterium]|nr:GNAT family N-acetyltransferase [Bacillota bacterium]
MIVKKAENNDYPAVKQFYYDITDDLETYEYALGWQKDVYPGQELLKGAVAAGDLYMVYQDGALAACMIVNHEYNDGYEGVRWSVEASDEELLVIHALGVRQAFSRHGLAKDMVRFVIDKGRTEGMKTLRLDVLEGNIPAEKVYTALGFQYVSTVRMFYEDTGWTNFRLFELIL